MEVQWHAGSRDIVTGDTLNTYSCVGEVQKHNDNRNEGNVGDKCRLLSYSPFGRFIAAG